MGGMKRFRKRTSAEARALRAAHLAEQRRERAKRNLDAILTEWERALEEGGCGPDDFDLGALTGGKRYALLETSTIDSSAGWLTLHETIDDVEAYKAQDGLYDWTPDVVVDLWTNRKLDVECEVKCTVYT